jgi:hypothetical protein
LKTIFGDGSFPIYLSITSGMLIYASRFLMLIRQR